jgi:hypothetical protein
MEIFITAVSCLVIGTLLGALIVTHPLAALRAVTLPHGDIEALKQDVANLKAKVAGTPNA